MTGWLLVGLFALWLSFPVYVFRHRIQRWFRAEVVNRNLAPHERWPEILHWRPGDEFEWSLNGWFTLISLREDGYAYVKEVTSKHKQCVPISSLVGRNQSLRDRRIDHGIKTTAEYMELINQFNIAYKELQERDKRNGIAA